MKTIKKQNEVLMVLSLLGIVPSLFYYLFDNKELFLILSWNTFLALLPFYFASAFNSVKTTIAKCVVTFLWLMFLPNAPYLITDIIHVYQHKGLEVFVFYLVGILSLTGILSWLFSVKMMIEKLPGRFYRWKQLGYLLLCILSGVGVSIGRFARLNSWEVFFKPSKIIEETLFMYNNPSPWIVTLIITLVLYSLSFKVTHLRLKL